LLTMKLAPCKRCRRHCRVNETSCPFCGARRLAIGASAVVFAALAVGWSGNAEADAPHDAAAAPDATATDAGTPDDPDGAAAEELRREQQEASRHMVPLYGVPPSPRQGCW